MNIFYWFKIANFCEFHGQLINLYNIIKKYIETIKEETKIKDLLANDN